MSNTITVEPGEHATFTTIRKDKPIQFAVSLEDHIALGEMLGASMERVGTLEGELAEATTLITTLRETLRDTQQSQAITSRALQAVKDQLRDAREENQQLHEALSKARRANVAILPGDGFASEKQTDTRPAIERAAYPDQALAREAGVSEPMGEGE